MINTRLGRPALGYVLPMALFIGMTALEGLVPRHWYPVAYCMKVVLVAVALCGCAQYWRHEIRIDRPAVVWGLAAGLLSFALWVGLDPYTPHFPLLGGREAFNPFEEIANSTWRTAFIVTRLCGMTLLIPIIEEVFWRSFLQRYLTRAEHWQALPLEAFSTRAALMVAGCFALAHPEWLVAMLFALTMAALLRATRSLSCCILAHATTNLALGLFVLKTGQWQYW